MRRPLVRYREGNEGKGSLPQDWELISSPRG